MPGWYPAVVERRSRTRARREVLAADAGAPSSAVSVSPRASVSCGAATTGARGLQTGGPPRPAAWIGERRRESDGDPPSARTTPYVTTRARIVLLARAVFDSAAVRCFRGAGVAQSICLRMNVGISMSLRSCSARSAGGAGAGRRAPMSVLGAGRGGGAVFRRGMAGVRCACSGMTGAPFAAIASTTGAAELARPCRSQSRSR